MVRRVNIEQGRKVASGVPSKDGQDVRIRGEQMRFLLTVAMLAGLTIVGAAQEKPKQFKTRPSAHSKVDANPKSTAAIKTSGGATTTSATSKQLRGVEHEHTVSGGSAHTSNKAPKTASLKPAKERPAPRINFGGGKGGSGTGTRRPDPYKGRLKQKGSGH